MGFLHQLWDETLAGPAPESGLGKLRKHRSLSSSRSSSVQLQGDDVGSFPVVSKNITILRNKSGHMPNLRISVDSAASVPSSPATPSTPTTPRSPSTPDGSIKKLMWGKCTPAAFPRGGESRTTTDYDWLVMNVLDR